MTMTRPTGPEFEEQVRSVARARWLLTPGGGSPERISGHDIDIVCRTEDIVHLIMATTERKLEKVTSDCSKLEAARIAEERKGNLAKRWVVTFFEPTNDQRQAGRDMGIEVMSLTQFRKSLINADLYLTARSAYRFGSATDATSGTTRVDDDEYIPLPLIDADGTACSLADLTTDLLAGRSIVLVGPFGAGKSLTVREVFRDLNAKFTRGESTQLPLPLNLREHWGQDDVSEALMRHARKIGYEPESQLVRAWNAGQFVALLDGFDELASRSWRVGPEAMKAARRESLTVVRRFIEERPDGLGVLIAGRSDYFDGPAELRSSLGLQLAPHRVVSVGEFSEDGVMEYLRSKRREDLHLPAWLPRKPLLLSYLASNNLLDDVLSIPDGLGIAHAWDEFLDRLTAREAQITQDIDGSGVRRLLEILAGRTRTGGSRGLLYEGDLTAAYLEAAGVEASEDARVLLQRLPGLTIRDDSEGGARTFVDGDMLDALRGSGVAAFVRSPFVDPISARPWTAPLGSLGVAMVTLLLDRWGLGVSQAAIAARQAVERWEEPTLALDVVASGGALAGSRNQLLDLGGLTISEGLVDAIDLEGMALDDVALKSCLVNELTLSDSFPQHLTLDDCMVGRVVGVAEARWLPPQLRKCEVAEFDAKDTNAAIMSAESIPLPVRTLLTVLRKVFIQRGAGRKEEALSRGLDPMAQRFVDPVLELLESEGLMYLSTHGSDRVWHANRSEQGRVLALLAEKDRSSDPLMSLVEGLE